MTSPITSLDGSEALGVDKFKPFSNLKPETTLLESDGLLGFISKISKIRKSLRMRIGASLQPIIDSEARLAADVIYDDLGRWISPGGPGITRYTISIQYQQAIQAYFYHTAMEPDSEVLTSVVKDSITNVQKLLTDCWAQSNVLLPPFLLGCAAFKVEQRMKINILRGSLPLPRRETSKFPKRLLVVFGC
jgi:hypothetical protein